MEITWSILSIPYLLLASQHLGFELARGEVTCTTYHPVKCKRTHAILIFFICTFYLAEEGKPSNTIRKTTGSAREQREFLTYDAPAFWEFLRENRHTRHLCFRHQAAKKVRRSSLSQNKFFFFCLITLTLL